MKSKYLTILILLYAFVNVSGLCHECDKNYAACHDDTHFSMCTSGIASDQMKTCPEGYVCTSKTSICIRSTAANPIQPTCQMNCGTCNSQRKLFSCLSNTTYALCFGTDFPSSDAQGSCPKGYFCNLESADICTKVSETSPSCNAILEPKIPTTTQAPITITTAEPTTGGACTCTTTEIIESTTKEIPNTSTVIESSAATSTHSTSVSTTRKYEYESSFCKGKEVGGPYKSEDDPTCRKYTLCYLLAGQYLELNYFCLGSNFFNEETRICQKEKPITCL